MDLLNRHRNISLLAAVLFLQVLGLAVQVKRPTEDGSTRLIRVWGITLITPIEKVVVHGQGWFHDVWRNYFYLRDVRRENDRLRDENTRLRLEQVRLAEDASQAQRLQALLKFKEQFISETVAAQVIGSSGSEQSRLVYIDKGSADGIQPDMAVVTSTGIVGKIIHVFPNTAQVLQINDQSSGVGAIFEKSRLQGIVRGTLTGDAFVHYIMSDDKVEVGEMVLTSGGDRVYPKGLPVGRVTQIHPGSDGFLNIRLKPSARLERLEEVLVITKVVEQEREMVPEVPLRASEILAQRLPTVTPRPPDVNAAAAAQGAPAAGATATPAGVPVNGKPAVNNAQPIQGNAPVTPNTAKPVNATVRKNTSESNAAKPKTPAGSNTQAAPGRDTR